jgi:hypothetical protein
MLSITFKHILLAFLALCAGAILTIIATATQLAWQAPNSQSLQQEAIAALKTSDAALKMVLAELEKARAEMAKAVAEKAKADAQWQETINRRQEVEHYGEEVDVKRVEVAATDKIMNKGFVEPFSKMTELEDEIIDLEEKLQSGTTIEQRLELNDAIVKKRRRIASLSKSMDRTGKNLMNLFTGVVGNIVPGLTSAPATPINLVQEENGQSVTRERTPEEYDAEHWRAVKKEKEKILAAEQAWRSKK